MEINHVQVIQKEYNGIQYYRIKFENQESQWYTLGEVESVIEHWRNDGLLGSFAIGCTLSRNAIIEWV